MSETGTPIKPLAVKCTAVGRPSNDSAYLSITTTDGRTFCFDLTFNQWRLHSNGSSSVVAAWPLPKDAA